MGVGLRLRLSAGPERGTETRMSPNRGPGRGHFHGLDRRAAVLDLQRRAGNAAVAGHLVPRVQRFDELEHKRAGDEGGGGREYLWSTAPGQSTAGPVEAKRPLPRKQTPLRDTPQQPAMCDPSAHRSDFQLTHGDIVMLSADGSTPATPTRGASRCSTRCSTWRLARRVTPGKQVRTQDEIIYAIYDNNPRDLRFSRQCTVEQPAGGPWWQYPKLRSSDVKRSAKDRFLGLAAKNRDRFRAPDEKQKGIGGVRDSSRGAYRGLHEDALLRAYRLARDGRDAGAAYAREAAAGHFLTDSFSAGHIRTRRASIEQYWDARYPRFARAFENLLAEQVSNNMIAQEGWVSTPLRLIIVGGTVLLHFTRKTVRKELAKLPPVTFTFLIGKIAHDVDNTGGLWVVNEVGERWKAFGDGHADEPDKDNRTPEMMRLAVSLGVDDVTNAELAGTIDRGQAERRPAELLTDVRARSSAPGQPGTPSYAPEQIVPRPDPDRKAENGVQNWTASSFDDLWELPVRTDDALTYGQAIGKGLQPGGAFYSKLAGVASDVPERELTLRPREAFMKFVRVLSNAPRLWLRKVIDRSG